MQQRHGSGRVREGTEWGCHAAQAGGPGPAGSSGGGGSGSTAQPLLQPHAHRSSSPDTVTMSGLATTIGMGRPRAAAAAAQRSSSARISSTLQGVAGAPSPAPSASVPCARMNSACKGGPGGHGRGKAGAVEQCSSAAVQALARGPPTPSHQHRARACSGACTTSSPRPSREMAPRAAHVRCRQRRPRPAHHASGRWLRWRWVTSPLVTTPAKWPGSKPMRARLPSAPADRRLLLLMMSSRTPRAARPATASTAPGYGRTPSCSTCVAAAGGLAVWAGGARSGAAPAPLHPALPPQPAKQLRQRHQQHQRRTPNWSSSTPR